MYNTKNQYRALLFSLALSLLTTNTEAQTRPINDTGVTSCGGATTGNNHPCLVTDPVGQDKHYGRDAAAMSGTLRKIGASAGAPNGQPNGFDYTKISNSGNALPASAALGTGPNDWACTRDNVSGLMWEVKTTTGLRAMGHTYSMLYFIDGPGLGSYFGLPNGGVCQDTGRCDVIKYAEDVNATGLCGQANWRLPVLKELEGLVDYARASPAIDPIYFPNTPNSYFWSLTQSTFLYLNDTDYEAWTIQFDTGAAVVKKRHGAGQLTRLVSGAKL